MTENEIAQTLENQIRELLGRALERSGQGEALARHPEAVASSWTPRGRKLGWIEPSPFKVLVLTEYGIGDPYDYPGTMKAFERVVNAIKRDPYIEDAGWESYNTAVQYFWVRPRLFA